MLLTVLLFAGAISFIQPWGEYAVNDDWDFYTHIRNFRQGDFVKNSLIDSSFVLQGLIGTAWSFIFGLSFTALRVLTLLITVILIVTTFKILDMLEVPRKLSFIAATAFVFYPFTMISAMSFMTEIYFLTLVSLGILFFLKYIKNHRSRYLLLATLFASLSILVRQIGFLVVPVIGLYGLWIDRKALKNKWGTYVSAAFIVVSVCFVYFSWPQYSTEGPKAFAFLSFALGSLVNFGNLFGMLFYSIPYFGLILVPFGLVRFLSLNKQQKYIALGITAVLFYFFYSVDIFKFGNMLYPEGILIKNNFIHHITLLDNIYFKLLLCFAVLLSFCSSLIGSYQTFLEYRDKNVLFLTLLFTSLTVPVLMYDGFFDRYLINSLYIFILIVAYVLRNLPITKGITFISLGLYVLYSIILIQDFTVITKTKWLAAEKLKKVRLTSNTLFLNDTYTKYNYVITKPNNSLLVTNMPRGMTYKCYVQRDEETDKNNFVYAHLAKLNQDKIISHTLANPKPFEEKTLPGFRPPTKQPSKILFKDYVFNLSGWFVGNKTFVVTYCND